jgi:hypothetical protein
MEGTSPEYLRMRVRKSRAARALSPTHKKREKVFFCFSFIVILDERAMKKG